MPLADRAQTFVRFGVPLEKARDLAGRIDQTMGEVILALYRSAVNVGVEWAPAVAQIKTPGLAVLSELDPFVKADRWEDSARRSGATIARLEGLGHWWPLQDAARTAKIWPFCVSGAGLGLQLYDKIHGKPYHVVYDDWVEFAKKHYIRLDRRGRLEAFAFYYDPIEDEVCTFPNELTAYAALAIVPYVGSVLGFLPMPYMALYAATKHAIEGYSESLDHELRTRGIRVSVIEPAYTKTQFDANVVEADSKLDEYRRVRGTLGKKMKDLLATADEPGVVAEVVLEAAGAARPKLRYTAGGVAKRLRVLRRFAPARLVDAGIRRDLQLD